MHHHTGGDPDKDNGDELLGNHRTFIAVKYRKGIPEDIRAKLKNAADATVALDREMSYVRGEIMDAQNSFNIKANIVSEIIVNIQNLYKVGNPREIQKIQDEFYSIYKKDDMELLENFAKQLDIIAEGYKAQSVR